MGQGDINALILSIADGDNQALSRLYQKTARGVYAFIYSYLKNHEDTEDALQTVYLKIKQYSHTYKSGTNARAWILQIAKNHSINQLNKRKKEVALTDNHFTSGGISSSSVNEVMLKCLTEEERNIIILHVLWGYRHREIAELLNCPTGTITSKYKRAVEKLKKELKEV